MRRARPFARMITLCLLCGCLCTLLGACASKKGGDEEQILDFRAKILAAQTLSMTVSLRADYGDRVYDFKLAYAGSGSKGTLTVLEPELIEGVVVEFGDTIKLQYEGAEFDTGAILSSGLNPVETLPLMFSAWRSGFVEESYRESVDGVDCIVVAIDLSAEGKDTVHKLWLDRETLLPVAGEIELSGYCVVSCKFADVVVG